MPNLRLKLCSILLLHNFQVYRHIKVITVNGRYIQQFRPAARTPPNEYTNRLNLKNNRGIRNVQLPTDGTRRRSYRSAGQRDERTDGRTPDRYIDPVQYTLRAASIKDQ